MTERASLAYPPPPEEYKRIGEEGADVKPPPIPSGPFTVLGQTQNGPDQTPTLEDMQIKMCYDPNKPPLMELKNINHQILYTFQKLIGIIATGEESPDETLEDMKNLFINAHHLLHKLRDAQAYEHMQQCIRNQKLELDAFKKKFDEQLASIASLQPP